MTSVNTAPRATSPARYKQSLDPTVDEVKKLCTSLRRNAKEERVLFHYNGHGVPRPTVNGEIWVFNKNYTQYIPLSIYDLQTWMGSPSIFVYDCSNAGIIVKSFKQFALQREQELEVAAINPNHPLAQMPLPPSMKNCIQLAACEASELLPMNPDLPADLFTSCLTTPIKIALRWSAPPRSLPGERTPRRGGRAGARRRPALAPGGGRFCAFRLSEHGQETGCALTPPTAHSTELAPVQRPDPVFRATPVPDGRPARCRPLRGGEPSGGSSGERWRQDCEGKLSTPPPPSVCLCVSSTKASRRPVASCGGRFLSGPGRPGPHRGLGSAEQREG
ncbi:hypothetical protein MATL_G00006470 [Megalops atlanticus]|uniref:Raptor N-terminal CASPase-like domain-containing protein n=1 Tax=Megalops atlanticus TaxID=7932 RepID=A0A9D3QGD6_MEGAT|nr:hypothetical protein MATL_G00006470 [Megalops atlanticus]